MSQDQLAGPATHSSFRRPPDHRQSPAVRVQHIHAAPA